MVPWESQNQRWRRAGLVSRDPGATPLVGVRWGGRLKTDSSVRPGMRFRGSGEMPTLGHLGVSRPGGRSGPLPGQRSLHPSMIVSHSFCTRNAADPFRPTAIHRRRTACRPHRLAKGGPSRSGPCHNGGSRRARPGATARRKAPVPGRSPGPGRIAAIVTEVCTSVRFDVSSLRRDADAGLAFPGVPSDRDDIVQCRRVVPMAKFGTKRARIWNHAEFLLSIPGFISVSNG